MSYDDKCYEEKKHHGEMALIWYVKFKLKIGWSGQTLLRRSYLDREIKVMKLSHEDIWRVTFQAEITITKIPSQEISEKMLRSAMGDGVVCMQRT